VKLYLCLLVAISIWTITSLRFGQAATQRSTPALAQESTQTTTQKNAEQDAEHVIYQVKQKDGSILYTDSPSATASPVEFSTSTQNLVAGIPVPPQPKIVPKTDVTYQVTITHPEPDATIRNNLGEITIRANQPSSPKAPRYRLIFDDKPIQSNTTGIFTLSDINRGAHIYKIELIDNKGKTLASTEQQTLFLHKASVLINRH